MIALAWEAGHAVIAALLLWTTAAVILAGLATVAAVRGVVGAWRRLHGPLSAAQASRANAAPTQPAPTPQPEHADSRTHNEP